MKFSSKGLLEICEHEGIVVAPYLDSVGVWTDGIGHTANAGGHDPKDRNKAMPQSDAEIEGAVIMAIRQFAIDAEKYERRVNDALGVEVEQHEFDALGSFDFNTGGIFKARLTRLLNGGDKEGAAKAFMGWLKPPEIRKRRTQEMRLFQTGNYDANGDQIPIWATNGKGKLTKVIKTMSGNDILALMRREKVTSVKKIELPVEKSRDKVSETKTIRAQVTQWVTANGMGLMAAWNSTDDTTRYMIFGAMAIGTLAGVIIFRDRLKAFAAGWK